MHGARHRSKDYRLKLTASDRWVFWVGTPMGGGWVIGRARGFVGRDERDAPGRRK